MWMLVSALLGSLVAISLVPAWTRWYSKQQVLRTEAQLHSLLRVNNSEEVTKLIEELQSIKVDMSKLDQQTDLFSKCTHTWSS